MSLSTVTTTASSSDVDDNIDDEFHWMKPNDGVSFAATKSSE